VEGPHLPGDTKQQTTGQTFPAGRQAVTADVHMKTGTSALISRGRLPGTWVAGKQAKIHPGITALSTTGPVQLTGNRRVLPGPFQVRPPRGVPARGAIQVPRAKGVLPSGSPGRKAITGQRPAVPGLPPRPEVLREAVRAGPIPPPAVQVLVAEAATHLPDHPVVVAPVIPVEDQAVLLIQEVAQGLPPAVLAAGLPIREVVQGLPREVRLQEALHQDQGRLQVAEGAIRNT